MSVFDPFYGVSRFGVAITKWLNRILIIAEIGYAACMLYWFRIGYGQPLEWYYYAGFLVVVPIAMTIVNVFVRKVWNIIVVFRYGSSDERVIADYYERKHQRQEQRQIIKRNRYLAKLEKETQAKEIASVRLDNNERRLAKY